MSTKAAELTKIAVNCFLTTKVSYANQVGQVMIKDGLEDEVDTVLNAIGSDTRIGTKYLGFGFGFGFGVGLDLEGYADLTKGNPGANWLSASDSTGWTRVGGDYITNTASIMYTQTFEKGTEDIEIDISEFKLAQWGRIISQMDSAADLLRYYSKYPNKVREHAKEHNLKPETF